MGVSPRMCVPVTVTSSSSLFCAVSGESWVCGRAAEAGGRDVIAGDVLVLGEDAIHSVANTRREYAVALHVYGGDFFRVERSEWDAETYEERPRDMARTGRLFDEANARWLAEG